MVTAVAPCHWVVECLDLVGRRRELVVLVHGGQVVLIFPPGESAVLSTAETRELAEVLHLTASDAESRP